MLVTCNQALERSIGQKCPGRMFMNCGRAQYNGARMCKAMGRACAKQWLAHVQSNGVRMAMACVNGACAKQLGEHAQGNCVAETSEILVSREFFFIFTSRSRSRAVSISLSLLEKE